MVQFYFLSVFFNLVGGYSLALVAMPTRSASFEGLRCFLRDPTVCLILGILSSVTGAFKLLTVIRGDIPVVGDFLPAVAGICVGLTLLLEHFRDPVLRASIVEDEGKGRDRAETAAEGKAEATKASWIERLLLEHKTAVGIAGMIAAAVHFLFPMVLFL